MRLRTIWAALAAILIATQASAYTMKGEAENDNGTVITWEVDTTVTPTCIGTPNFRCTFRTDGTDIATIDYSVGSDDTCDRIQIIVDTSTDFLQIQLSQCGLGGPFAWQLEGEPPGGLDHPEYINLDDYTSGFQGSSDIVSATTDSDGDGVYDWEDNCVLEANANQIAIVDNTGSGGARFERGAVCSMDFNQSGASDGSDYTIFVEQYGKSVGMSCDSFSGGCQ